MPREGTRHGAFISYARHDGEEIAHALHARLAAEVSDVPAWLDRLELEGGIGWWKQIEEQLASAEFLLLIMTPVAVKSENTRREWRTARQLGVCVYPIAAHPTGNWTTGRSRDGWAKRTSTIRSWNRRNSSPICRADAGRRAFRFVTAGDTSGRVHILRLDGIR